MSRTLAHVPTGVELARAHDKSILRTIHGKWDGSASVCCTDEKCFVYLPRWASKRREARCGTAFIERRTAVDMKLLQAIKEYRTTGDVPDDVYADPEPRRIRENGPVF